MFDVIYLPCSRQTTGSAALDMALGGGWPRGYISEIYGEESYGKTTLLLLSIAALHRANPEAVAVFIDSAHSLSAQWARQCGVDTDRIIVTQPVFAKDALDITTTAIEAGHIHMLVIDDVYALDFGYEMADLDAAMKTAGRLNNFIYSTEAPLEQARIPMLVVNRQYEGLHGRDLYGGHALKVKKAISVQMLKPRHKDGLTLRFDVRRNKTAEPFKKGELDVT